MRYALVVLVLLLASVPVFADQYLPPTGRSGGSSGAVLERRAGTTGNTFAPVDEANPLPARGLYNSVQAIPTVTAGAYSTGQVVGGLLTFTDILPSASMGGFVQTAVVTFKATVTGPLDLFVFNNTPTSTLTDNAALALSTADLPLSVGVVHITDCTSGGSGITVCQNQSLAGVFGPLAGSSKTLYGVLVARAAMTLGSTSDVTVALSIGQ